MSRSTIDRGAPASLVAAKFGGTWPFAQKLKRSPGTVHRWIVNGYIPGKYHDEIIACGEEQSPKIKVKPADFVDNRTREKREYDLAQAQANAA